jgi:hypothetical protein
VPHKQGSLTQSKQNHEQPSIAWGHPGHRKHQERDVSVTVLQWLEAPEMQKYACVCGVVWSGWVGGGGVLPSLLDGFYKALLTY